MYTIHFLLLLGFSVFCADEFFPAELPDYECEYFRQVEVMNFGVVPKTDIDVKLVLNTKELYEAGKMQDGCENEIHLIEAEEEYSVMNLTYIDLWMESSCNESAVIWFTIDGTIQPLSIRVYFLYYGCTQKSNTTVLSQFMQYEGEFISGFSEGGCTDSAPWTQAPELEQKLIQISPFFDPVSGEGRDMEDSIHGHSYSGFVGTGVFVNADASGMDYDDKDLKAENAWKNEPYAGPVHEHTYSVEIFDYRSLWPAFFDVEFCRSATLDFSQGMILLFDSPPDAGSGVSVVEEAHGKYLRGGAEYGNTGGSNFHAHGAQFDIWNTFNDIVEVKADGGVVEACHPNHTHITTMELSPAFHGPPYHSFIVAKLEAEQLSLTPNMFIMATQAPPKGYSRFDGANSMFVMGDDLEFGLTGGSYSHRHEITSTVSHCDYSQRLAKVKDEDMLASPTHTHSSVADPIFSDDGDGFDSLPFAAFTTFPYVAVPLYTINSDVGNMIVKVRDEKSLEDHTGNMCDKKEDYCQSNGECEYWNGRSICICSTALGWVGRRCQERIRGAEFIAATETVKIEYEIQKDTLVSLFSDGEVVFEEADSSFDVEDGEGGNSVVVAVVDCAVVLDLQQTSFSIGKDTGENSAQCFWKLGSDDESEGDEDVVSEIYVRLGVNHTFFIPRELPRRSRRKKSAIDVEHIIAVQILTVDRHSKSFVELPLSYHSSSGDDDDGDSGVFETFPPLKYIIGGVGGVFLLLILVIVVVVVVIVVVFVRNELLKKKLTKFSDIEDIDLLIAENELANKDMPNFKINKNLFKIDVEELKMVKKIDSGASGSVWKAKWGSQVVGCKIYHNALMAFETQVEFDAFEREMNIVASISHPNLINFHGFSLKGARMIVVMPWCENGSLNRYIMKNDVSLRKKILFLEGIIEGDIIHRDLKPGNVLLDSTLTVKLIDFDLSRSLEEAKDVEMTRNVGTSYYRAPEVMSGHYDLSADTQNTSERLFLRGNMESSPLQITVDDYDPETRPFMALLASMLIMRPEERPSFKQLRSEFTEIKKELEWQGSALDGDGDSEELKKAKRVIKELKQDQKLHELEMRKRNDEIASLRRQIEELNARVELAAAASAAQARPLDEKVVQDLDGVKPVEEGVVDPESSGENKEEEKEEEGEGEE